MTQIPVGHFARTKSVTKILSLGILTSSMINMSIPRVAELGHEAVVCARVVMGFFQGCLIPCTYTLMARWIPPIERTRLGWAEYTSDAY